MLATKISTSFKVPNVVYATFWRRLIASLIDGFLLAVVQYFLLSSFAEDPSQPSKYLIWTNVFIGMLYESLMESGDKQATLGKMAMRIKVTGLQGERITFKNAVIRHASKYLSALLFFIGFIMALFTEKSQALHDIIAETVVIDNTATAG